MILLFILGFALGAAVAHGQPFAAFIITVAVYIHVRTRYLTRNQP